MATKKAETTEGQEWSPLAALNVKNCGCDPKIAVRNDKTTYLLRIWGEVSSIKTKENRSGDMYSYMIGAFRAVRADGAKFESEKLFLPGGIFEQVEGAYKAGGEAPVQFAYDIFSQVDADSSLGYRYAAKSLAKPESSSRLDAMSQEIMKKAAPKD
jgi:hypothetical protein